MSKQSHPKGEAVTPKAEDVTKSALATVGNNILPFVIGGGSGIVATTCLQPIVSGILSLWHQYLVGCSCKQIMTSQQRKIADRPLLRIWSKYDYNFLAKVQKEPKR